MRPIYPRVEPRVRAPNFVAALALLLDRLLPRRLQAAGVDLSASAALETVQTIRQVTFKLDGKRRGGVSAASARAHPVLAALGLRQRRPPAPPPTEETVMW